LCFVQLNLGVYQFIAVTKVVGVFVRFSLRRFSRRPYTPAGLPG
jgi:hypothetical protein